MNRIKGLSLDSAVMLRDALEVLDPDNDDAIDTKRYLLSQLYSIIEYLESEAKK